MSDTGIFIYGFICGIFGFYLFVKGAVALIKWAEKRKDNEQSDTD